MKGKKHGTGFVIWTDKEEKSLFIQQGDRISIIPVRPGSFTLEPCSDKAGYLVIFTTGLSKAKILEVENEIEGRQALHRIRVALIKGRKQPLNLWPVVTTVAGVVVVGILFALLMAAQTKPVPVQEPVAPQVPVSEQVQPPPVVEVTPEVPTPPVASGWIDPLSLPVATKWTFGNPKGIPLYVFSDPQCSYCKKLEQTLEELKDEYFLHVYPIPRLGDDSTALITQFACDADPASAWSKWMATDALNDKAEIKQECASAAMAAGEVNRKFMDSHNIYAVPVLVRQDGAVHIGGMDKASLQAWLQSKEVTSKASSSCN